MSIEQDELRQQLHVRRVGPLASLICVLLLTFNGRIFIAQYQAACARTPSSPDCQAAAAMETTANVPPHPTVAPSQRPTRPQPSPTAQRLEQRRVTVDGLAVRAQAGADNPRVGVVVQGDVIELLGPTTPIDGRDWYLIRTRSGLEGWVSSRYLSEMP